MTFYSLATVRRVLKILGHLSEPILHGRDSTQKSSTYAAYHGECPVLLQSVNTRTLSCLISRIPRTIPLALSSSFKHTADPLNAPRIVRFSLNNRHVGTLVLNAFPVQMLIARLPLTPGFPHGLACFLVDVRRRGGGPDAAEPLLNLRNAQTEKLVVSPHAWSECLRASRGPA